MKEPAMVGKAQRQFFVATASNIDTVHVEYFLDEACQQRKGEFEVDTSKGDTAQGAVELLPDGVSFTLASSKRRFRLAAANTDERTAWAAVFQGKGEWGKGHARVCWMCEKSERGSGGDVWARIWSARRLRAACLQGESVTKQRSFSASGTRQKKKGKLKATAPFFASSCTTRGEGE